MMNNIIVFLALLIVCVGTANSLTCYYCADCPVPFDRYSPYVTKQYSTTGWCAKKSTTAVYAAKASRGMADPRLCIGGSGCRWTYDSFGAYVYACCCRNDLCNTGHITSKSTITILFGALTLLLFNRYC
ncbi:unnamed protein product [Adineta steineri]|uniref:Uncharacterized protein n=1 Tax=Adineta steineri TaxID=433720 RepID=A0A814CXF7_9BILA|nr:unnamed protein product [Adineta steineri]CAF0946261.1 unnamed protein product [Adineta steineri]CAF3620096.1 unnamed protein product [Adineta steineri]CAF3620955.1 unnamed protein product [Adineta steineri]